MAKQTGARDVQTTTAPRVAVVRPKVGTRRVNQTGSAAVQTCIQELTRLTLDIKQQLRITSH